MERADESDLQPMSTKQPHRIALAERHIIRRTRLLAELRSSSAKTILLVAPAGYGKTTLAQQWLQCNAGAALTVTPACRDIPVLARELSRALACLVLMDPRRIEAALRSANDPAAQASAVARTVLAQIGDLHDGNCWLVIDDYHLLLQSRAAESFIDELERSGQLRLLICSRQRPAWATSRRFVHGEIAELGPPDLALDEAESREIIPLGVNSEQLLEHARGWPAVIGLAAHCGSTSVSESSHPFSESLYDYFAEELYEAASPRVRKALVTIALLPPIAYAQLHGEFGFDVNKDQIVETGLVQRDKGVIEAHPLARSFLNVKAREYSDFPLLIDGAIAFCLKYGYWDESFELMLEFQMPGRMEQLLIEALPSLSDGGRTATIRAFCSHAGRSGNVRQAILDLIEAELALRDGSFDQALELSRDAARRMPADHPLEARCYIAAGKAAHLTHRLSDAFGLYTVATQLASKSADLNDATWGQCSAALFLESERADDAVRELELLRGARPEDRLRVLTAHQHQAYLGEAPDRLLTDGEHARHLLGLISDPWVRTAWGNTYGYSLVLRAHYREAEEVLTATSRELEEFGLTFGATQIQWSLAAVALGLRQFTRCDGILRRLEARYSEQRDMHGHLNVRALRARLCLAQLRPEEALRETCEVFDRFPTRAMYGEYLATRAVALAVAGEFSTAMRVVREASALTRSVDTRVLCACAAAIAADGDDVAVRRMATMALDDAARLRSWDAVVCAARASAAFAQRLSEIPGRRGDLRDLLGRSNDSSLARAIGLDSRAASAGGLLSTREGEVLDLIAAGLKNPEIARVLFIAPSTVKAHIDKIFEKLGTRTRAEAVARYSDMLAASAVGVSYMSGSSSAATGIPARLNSGERPRR